MQKQRDNRVILPDAEPAVLDHGERVRGGWVWKCERCGVVEVVMQAPGRQHWLCWYCNHEDQVMIRAAERRKKR